MSQAHLNLDSISQGGSVTLAVRMMPSTLNEVV